MLETYNVQSARALVVLYGEALRSRDCYSTSGMLNSATACPERCDRTSDCYFSGSGQEQALAFKSLRANVIYPMKQYLGASK